MPGMQWFGLVGWDCGMEMEHNNKQPFSEGSFSPTSSHYYLHYNHGFGAELEWETTCFAVCYPFTKMRPTGPGRMHDGTTKTPAGL